LLRIVNGFFVRFPNLLPIFHAQKYTPAATPLATFTNAALDLNPSHRERELAPCRNRTCNPVFHTHRFWVCQSVVLPFING